MIAYVLLPHQLYNPALAINNLVCLKSSFCISESSQNDMSDNAYESGTSSVAFVTVPDDKIAKKLSRGLVEQNLAACVNIIPNIQSVYLWQGKINEDGEYLMIIKTRTSRIEELTKWVRDNHPYSVAEVITLPIQTGNLPYMKWLAESVPDKQ
ncbi:hypothetical protein DOY81_010312 [Sarcophaga bullata]|nr:hypothetical protein DOY81_010312 [Sarcophaga bullata]